MSKYPLFERTGTTAWEIALIAVYTGAATINGQSWVSSINYSQSVNIAFNPQNSRFPTELGLHIRKAKSSEPLIKNVAEAALMRLVGMLARLCGVRLQGFTPDIPGFARCFAQAAANIPEAQALSTALSAMHSLSIVSQVRNMIACAIQLADAKEGFIAKQFAFTPIVSPTLIAVEDSVINNLQVRLCPSEDLRGFIFGFDILCSFQNALAQGFFEVFTTHVADKIKFRIAQPVYNQESDCFLSSFIVDISGVKAMEEYMQGLIDDKKSAIFMNFGSETAAGSGNFTATLGMDDSYVPMSAIAVDFKITEMMFTNRPIYPPRY